MNDPRNPLKRVAGFAMFLGGAALALWLVYNLFIDPQSEFIESAGGRMRSSVKGLALAVIVAAFGAGMAFGRRKSENASSPADLPSITHEKHAEIRSLLERGMKIQAIQRYREATGTGLAEAKSYVDQLGRAA